MSSCELSKRKVESALLYRQQEADRSLQLPVHNAAFTCSEAVHILLYRY